MPSVSLSIMRHYAGFMPSEWREPVVDEATIGAVKQRGGSMVVRVPPSWPEGREVRILLLPAKTKEAF